MKKGILVTCQCSCKQPDYFCDAERPHIYPGKRQVEEDLAMEWTNAFGNVVKSCPNYKPEPIK
jgi:hypothetical protein